MPKPQRVLTQCPTCKKFREVDKSHLSHVKHGKRTGDCRSCATKKCKTGKNLKQFIEILPNGSEIYWKDRTIEARGGNHTVKVKCGKCGFIRLTNHHNRSFTGYCRKCKTTNTGPGERAPSWKGGKSIERGYINIHKLTLSLEEQILFASMFTISDKYCREHRIVVARKLGRPLLKSEIIHHINGIRNDNRPENLELVDSLTHKTHDMATNNRLRGEIKRLQDLLDKNGISYQRESFVLSPLKP